MKLLADECCDALLVAGLRADGHDVLYAMESLRGCEDESILSEAASQNRILVTEDKDFGELALRFALPVYGLLLLRMNPGDHEAKLARIRSVLGRYSAR